LHFRANLVPAEADGQGLRFLASPYELRQQNASEILDLNLIFVLGAGKIGKVLEHSRKNFYLKT